MDNIKGPSGALYVYVASYKLATSLLSLCYKEPAYLHVVMVKYCLAE